MPPADPPPDLDPAAHCRETARSHDRPRYLAALFLAAAARPAAFATLALNVELARVAEVVSEPLLGEMRLQWWRDAITAEVPPQHPVVQVLAASPLAKPDLLALVDARAADIYPEPCADLPALAAYAAATAGQLLVLWQHAGGHGDSAALDAARDLGTAWALMGLVRAAPFHRRRGKAFLPPTAATGDVLARAEHYLRRSQDMAQSLPAPPRRALRLAVLARRELAHLARHAAAAPLPPRPDSLDALHLWIGA